MQNEKRKGKRGHLTNYNLVLCGYLYFERGWKRDWACCLGALCSAGFLDMKPSRGKKYGEGDPVNGYIHRGAKKQV